MIYLHEPLLWTLRQHATNGVSGPDSLARAIGAVAPPLLEITARVGEFSELSCVVSYVMAGHACDLLMDFFVTPVNGLWHGSCPCCNVAVVRRLLSRVRQL